jgi:hypothetical protein
VFGVLAGWDLNGLRYGRRAFCCSWVLVEKKVGYTWIHNHKKGLSTWKHAEHVKKNDYLTWKQVQENKLIPKRGLSFKRTCGFL